MKQLSLFNDNPFAFLGKTDFHNVIVSFSGGRSSALMAKKMKEDEYWSSKNLVFVFANTGKERPETLSFVNRCDQEFELDLVWVEAKVNPVIGEGTTFNLVNYSTASRKGEPFHSVTAKYGISNAAFPHCSRELKQRPINTYAESIFGKDYVTALGIRVDEIRRLKKGVSFVFPLAAWSITTDDVREFWNRNHFDLRLRDYEGNCDLCWKKSLRKLMTIVKERPSVSDWWMEMETRYSNLQVPGRQENVGAHWNRDNLSIKELIELSRKPFIPVSDSLYRPTPEMDSEQACQCFRQDIEETALD